MITHEPGPVPRILVIDDNLSIHEDFKKILLRTTPSERALDDLEASLFGEAKPAFVATDFRVDFADQGKEALAMVKKARDENDPYSLAFVDGRMPPGWDGIETIKHLWHACPDLQVVLCTAYADYTWEEIQYELGPTDSLVILKKPFDIAEVLQLSHVLTRKWEMNRQIQGRLNQLAYFDPLTNLPNRTLFLDSLTRELLEARNKQTSLALLYIDLNDFKRINDTLGHSVGDDLLKIIAQRLTHCLRNSDVIEEATKAYRTARLGGDEFTVMLPDIDSKETAAKVAHRLAKSLSQPIDLGQHRVLVTPSIGISLFPGDGEEVDTLLKNADLAMYFAKRNGPALYQFYQEFMNTDALKRLTLETQLRHALQRNEFSLVYQPQFDLKTGKMSGLETLLRWENQELGQVPPMEFIPVAEASGMIHNLGEWVLRTACRQARQWLDLGYDLPRIAVNVSPMEFGHPDFLASVKSALEESGLEAKRLQIEITETLLMDHFAGTARTLEELDAMGIEVAIDDFGKGYSNLSRLQALKIDCLKIDRSFVSGIDSGFREQSVLNAIISMANSMNMEVIAEGVETQSQYRHLREKQCNEAQGYLLSWPLNLEQTNRFLREAPLFHGDLPPDLFSGV